jgi:hypothetical protein
MTTSTIPAAINYLVSTARTQWAADQTVIVFDGPTPAASGGEFANRVWIGADPMQDDAPGFEAVVGDQDVATMTQGRTRDEQYAIACAIEHWDGGSDLAAARATAFGYLATFEGFLRGVPGTGGPGNIGLAGALGLAGWAQLKGGIALHQEQQTSGCVALITFHVSCRARLTTP